MLPSFLYYKHAHKDLSPEIGEVTCAACSDKQPIHALNMSHVSFCYFLQIVAEALSEKYNVQINMEKTIILNNRKFIGTLVSHRVRNDDVQRAQPAAAGPAAITSQDTASTPDRSGKLVQEINEKDAAAIKSTRQVAGGSQDLQYKLRARVRDDSVDEIHAEIYLPNCVSINSIHWQKERTIKVNALFKQVSSQEVSLDVGEDRILVESHRHGYVFDKFVNYRLQQDRAQALFDKTSKVTHCATNKKATPNSRFVFLSFQMLQIRIPVFSN